MENTQTDNPWLSEEDLSTARDRVPIVYVDAVPVRTDEAGNVTRVGLMLRAMPDGTVSLALVSGRVMWGERVRDALVRHLEKDLGSLALPRIPLSPSPFTIAEYFPDPEKSGFYDPRQHAVSLVFLIPIDGICEPNQSSLEISWVTPAEAVSPEVIAEMTSGHDRLVRLGLAHAGQLP